MTYAKIKVYLTYFLFIFFLLFLFLMTYRLYQFMIPSGIMIMIIVFYIRHIEKIKETTLCLIVKNDKVLMMLRNKKAGDVHINKYNGLGGKVEKGESHEQCVLREVREEAGIKLKDYHYTGKVVFRNFAGLPGKEVMYTYYASDYENEIGECNEGDLVWIDKDKVLDLPLWEGDKYFLPNIIENRPFTAFLHYNNDKVVDYKVRVK